MAESEAAVSSAPTLRTTSGTFPLPLRKWYFVIPVLRISRSRRYFAKAGRVRDREVHVFVKVKHLHVRPYYARHRGQSIQDSNCEAPVAAMIRALPLF
jgi:hypothetical protein